MLCNCCRHLGIFILNTIFLFKTAVPTYILKNPVNVEFTSLIWYNLL